MCTRHAASRSISRYPSRGALSLLLSLFALQLSACSEWVQAPQTTERDASVEAPALFSGSAVGAPCAQASECRLGLRCEGGSCVPSGSSALDEPCIQSAECMEGLKCGWGGFCVAEGLSEEGNACSHNGECRRGLYCRLTGGLAGQCALPEAGAGSLHASCAETGECAEGLTCSPESQQCLPGSLLLNPEAFRGIPCDEAGEAALPFGARHLLPGSGGQFYDLPFPNDIRLRGDRPDLSGHPVPGAAFTARDLLKQLIERLEEEERGWSLNPAVYFRFTRPLDETFLAAERIRFINLETNEEHPFEHSFVRERNKYQCGNILYVHPLWSRPLEPNTTYAVLVESYLKAEDGSSPEQLDALPQLLSDTVPAEEDAREAWRRYGKLRDWLNGPGDISRSSIAAATVFTTGSATPILVAGSRQVQETDIPRFVGRPTLCEEGTLSPCATPNYEPPAQSPNRRDPRDCPAEPHPDFHELHGLLRMPNFQRGTLPFEESGGDLRLEGERPQLLGYQEICVSLTIPKAQEMPPEGWPTLVFAHGTNGSFRSGAALIGADVSKLTVDGEAAGAVIVAIDQPMHGSRKGEDQSLSPGPLFFNVNNPGAARGNLMQGAFDVFALLRFVEGFSQELPGAGQVRLNPERISYYGHSQGATTGPLALPFAEQLQGAALSGSAGSIVFSLIGKKEPYDSAVGLRLALQELELDEYHPALHIYQHYFDAVDPLNFARYWNREAPNGLPYQPLHTLQILGQEDRYTPASGQRALAGAAYHWLATPEPLPSGFDLMEDILVTGSAYPIQENVRQGAAPSTAVTVQYRPPIAAPSEAEDEEGLGVEGGETLPEGFAYDGHFVAFRHPSARAQLLQFIGELSLGLAPQIDAPRSTEE